MRRIAMLGVGLMSSLGLFFAAAPSAHAAPNPKIISVCITIREINFGPDCIVI